MATRTVKLRANDGLLELELTARLKSNGLTPLNLSGRKLAAAAALHAVARDIGFNPLDIRITDEKSRRR